MKEERLIQDEEARHQEGRDDRSLFHQLRGSIKIDAPRFGVTTQRAVDRTRPGERDGSGLFAATRASRREVGRGLPVPPEHTPSSSARIDMPRAGSAAARAGNRE